MNLIDELEKLGEQEVRKHLASNVYGDPRNSNYISVQHWLRSKEIEGEEARAEESFSISRKALEISEEANSISKDSNAISERANRISDRALFISKIAILAAIISAIITAISTYIAYIKTP